MKKIIKKIVNSNFKFGCSPIIAAFIFVFLVAGIANYKTSADGSGDPIGNYEKLNIVCEGYSFVKSDTHRSKPLGPIFPSPSTGK
jgi:hypothetical protein